VLWFRFICRRKTESSMTSGSYERPHRTCTRKQLDTGTEYAVLSHCWGLIPFTTLTRERLSCFMQDGIADEILPANFLDAIWMCRQLQIRYLWIDSLCIIQSRFRHLCVICASHPYRRVKAMRSGGRDLSAAYKAPPVSYRLSEP
jgi:hypothetical protein